MGPYGRSRLVVLERFGQVIQIPDTNATEIHDDVAFAHADHGHGAIWIDVGDERAGFLGKLQGFGEIGSNFLSNKLLWETSRTYGEEGSVCLRGRPSESRAPDFLWRRTLTERQINATFLAQSEDVQIDRHTRHRACDEIPELIGALDRLAVDGRDDITAMQTSRLSRSIYDDTVDHDASEAVVAERSGKIVAEWLERDADPAAHDVAGGQDTSHDTLGHVRGYRERDPHVAVTSCNDGIVDADDLASKIHERTAAIAGVDRCIGLYEVAIFRQADIRPPLGADDPRGDGVIEAERIAHSQHPLSDTNVI